MDSTQAAVGLPPGFDLLPPRAQRVLDALRFLPTIRTHGYAWCANDFLAERTRSDRRTVQRACRDLEARGILQRVQVPRLGLLPDGSRARWWQRWIFVVGPSWLALTGASDVPPCHPESVTVSPYSPESKTQKKLKPEPAPIPPTVDAQEDDEDATREAVAHYAHAAGKPGYARHKPILVNVLPFIWEMNGSRATKIERACRVIDAVIAAQLGRGRKFPTIGYIFAKGHFWRHLTEVDREDEAVRSALVARMRADGLLLAVEPELAELDPLEVAAERVRQRSEIENKSHGGTSVCRPTPSRSTSTVKSSAPSGEQPQNPARSPSIVKPCASPGGSPRSAPQNVRHEGGTPPITGLSKTNPGATWSYGDPDPEAVNEWLRIYPPQTG